MAMGIRMNAKEVAARWQEELAEQAEAWKTRGVEPCLATVLVEGDPASAYYAEAKRKRAEKLGFRFELVRLSGEVEQAVLEQEVQRLSDREDVHGIMVELPLPRHIDGEAVLERLTPWKDVDGVTAANRQACHDGRPGLWPATPQACLALLEAYGHQLEGKHVVLIGRGETVGRPLMQMLLRAQATLTVCHSRTRDLARHVQAADIVITAAGRAGLLTPEMVHPELVVIDAGINETEQGIAGDATPGLEQQAAAVSPVPGGVGTLTTLVLMRNVLRAVEVQQAAKQQAALTQPSRLFDQRVRDFVRDAASDAPTPGGGSVAALASALGAAMGSMVGRLSSGPRYPETSAEMTAMAVKMAEVIAQSERLAELDVAVFQRYMSALGLPKAAPEECAQRKAALLEASQAAAEVPLELMRCASRATELLASRVAAANPHVISDLGVAVSLLSSAVESAWLTVVINTKPYPAEPWAIALREEGAKLRQDTTQTAAQTLASIHDRL